MFVAALFRLNRIPGNPLEVRLAMFPGGIHQAYTVTSNHGYVVLVENKIERVYGSIAGTSEATKPSPSTEPTTRGAPSRTATIFCGSSVERQVNANTPRNSDRVFRTASSRFPLK